jgi:hypothetical protein
MNRRPIDAAHSEHAALRVTVEHRHRLRHHGLLVQARERVRVHFREIVERGALEG